MVDRWFPDHDEEIDRGSKKMDRVFQENEYKSSTSVPTQGSEKPSEHSIIKQHPRILSEPELKQISANREVAREELSKLSSGHVKFHMSIPVRADDTDMVMEQALSDSQRLQKEVIRLRSTLSAIVTNGQVLSSQELSDIALAALWDGYKKAVTDA